MLEERNQTGAVELLHRGGRPAALLSDLISDNSAPKWAAAGTAGGGRSLRASVLLGSRSDACSQQSAAECPPWRRGGAGGEERLLGGSDMRRRCLRIRHRKIPFYSHTFWCF